MYYWSSINYARFPDWAWMGRFLDADDWDRDSKPHGRYGVRAVRSIH
jgi:hypothetical protein